MRFEIPKRTENLFLKKKGGVAISVTFVTTYSRIVLSFFVFYFPYSAFVDLKLACSWVNIPREINCKALKANVLKPKCLHISVH